MTTDLQPKFVTEGATKRIPTDVAQEILRTVASIEYGSIEIVIHEGKVVQIECREKIRVNQSGSGRKTSKS
ncbi:YezD family protein [Nitrosomonas sp. Nm166]|uniref:YezD family protein n=1 Tax=Nitrosomonas sp. Nm166 TaxID=1881054 RepID=UPI0008E6B9B4|nr:YezD family protein [Nitrosomonas sp. Nm166]SFD97971.1 hypothetical protein SAMN05428977_100438 [Nitrosomonas sp. Nm166]